MTRARRRKSRVRYYKLERNAIKRLKYIQSLHPERKLAVRMASDFRYYVALDREAGEREARCA